MDFDKIVNRHGTDCIKYDAMEQFIGATNILPMWVADMDFETPDFVMDAIRKRAEHPIVGYSFRSDEWKQAVADWMLKRHGWMVNINEISFSPGVVPALYLALKGFSQAGDSVVVQPPVYFPFFTTVTENQRQLIYNPLTENGGRYMMNFNDLDHKIDEKTKMIFLSNPHNPVGRVWRKDELETLVDICHRRNILIISDEIHSDLIFKPHKHIPISGLNSKAREITLTLMAPSKTFNMAGLSTSIVIAQNPELLKIYNKELEATHLGLGNVFGNVATKAAYSFGESWLNSLLEYLHQNIRLVENFVQQHQHIVRMTPVEATYLLWLDFRQMQMDDQELKRFFFDQAKLGVNLGVIFGREGSGFVRMNVALPKSKLLKALEQLDYALKNISK